MMMEGLSQPVTVTTVFDDHAPRDRTPVAAAKSDGQFRLMLCGGFFMFAFAVMILRLGYLAFGMDDEIRLIRVENAVPIRPEVVDRNGRPLIMNSSAEGLAIDGRDIWDVEEAVSGLQGLFPTIDADRLRTRLAKKQYTLVMDSIQPEERQAVIALGLPGLRFPDTTGRAYPQRDLAAHVVGYTIPGRGGVVGVEKALDLTMKPGAKGPVRLSIDLVAQQVLEDELAGALQTFSAKAAWGVLLDANTGEVRALASLPDYNPNQPGSADTGAWRNRAMSDVYEMGSAFKPITVAAALENGVIELTDQFDVATPLKIGAWTIDDYSHKKSPMTTAEVVQYSSNIGTIQIVQRLGVDGFRAVLETLNLDRPLATELAEAGTPMLSKEWRPSELASSSYGHGIAVSPLQLTAAFAAVVNGGTYYAPTFIDGGAGKQHQAFSRATSDQMRIVLRKTVTDGTGGKAEVAGFYPIGKTSTADKPGIGGYDDHGELISSFIGAFPGYDPQYVLLVSFDEPQGIESTYGYATAGYVAAPVFKRVVERVAPALGLMPVGDDVAFDGFVGLRREQGDRQLTDNNALTALLTETEIDEAQ
ncbi:penicillin-binding protein 2 [Parvularcula sp. LCG005]|uniref:peptidoglycan D,D-transpeptidase FtsI family protein n=1 Tax=Parvularcula sp. LCG005 TaxID=3078805 RepID=UPI0029434100|nr:penicillin-binding protein 2 [Parvularcula sp. LCG005]WOI52128.1 penicillin-binding protein 2 [Parvularcula sp. LCG005]